MREGSSRVTFQAIVSDLGKALGMPHHCAENWARPVAMAIGSSKTASVGRFKQGSASAFERSTQKRRASERMLGGRRWSRRRGTGDGGRAGAERRGNILSSQFFSRFSLVTLAWKSCRKRTRSVQSPIAPHEDARPNSPRARLVRYWHEQNPVGYHDPSLHRWRGWDWAGLVQSWKWSSFCSVWWWLW
jgi:hypothetical protein